MSKRVTLSAWIAFIVVLDQATAWWARETLSSLAPIHIVGTFFTFVLLYNRGAMLGLGAGIPVVITIVGMAVTGGLVYFAYRAPARFQGPLATMAGGGLGNVLSRLVWHRVTDFMHFAFYPGVFNVSDVAIRVGMVWGLIAMWKKAPSQPNHSVGT